MIKKLISNRNQILFIELAGLLHDIGKLSKAFLEYRQKWQDDPHGWDNDPHDHEYLKKEIFKDLIPTDFNKQIKDIKPPNGYDFCEPDFTIRKAVHFHTDPPQGALINYMLKAADGVDSAIDRNNPLWSNEQKTGNIYRSNVFGYETGRIIALEDQEDARQELYHALNTLLPIYLQPDAFKYSDRLQILKKIKDAFEQGLSDTTRPQNDTTLWEHSYAVASILKVITVHNMFCDSSNEKMYKFDQVKFGVLGIGWDGMRFISQGQKIGDIVGRKRIIEDVKNKLKELIESEYPVGNEIYSDDDGIYFIMPFRLKDNFKTIWEKLEQDIYTETAGISDGELQPHITDIDNTKTLTSLVKAIKDMREKTKYHYDGKISLFNEFSDKLKNFQNGKSICPICRLRPIEDEEERKIFCRTCKDRRKQRGEEDGVENDETVFIDEIVDKNKRASLIVARFGLNEWLNGDMVRSLFVTEAKGIERECTDIENVKSFEEEHKKIKAELQQKKREYGDFNYNRIKGDIDAVMDAPQSERAKYTAFLYDRMVVGKSMFRNTEKTRDSWNDLCRGVLLENPMIDIYNLLCSKTPTPSTVFDVWETTKIYLEKVPQRILKALLKSQVRLKLKVQLMSKSDNIDFVKEKGRAFDADVVFKNGSKTTSELLIVAKDEIEIIGENYPSDDDWIGAKIAINDKGSHIEMSVDEISKGVTFYPYRSITESPNLFMAIVPADRAIEISALIYQKYIEQFGKVMGRLPFSIGNIFFGNKMPMFVVLDAGKRMVVNFDSLSEKTDEIVLKDKTKIQDVYRFGLKANIGGFDKTLTWQLPYKLGNCETDYHHPYFIINTEKDLSSERQTFFKTIAGSVVHFDEIEKDDVLRICPNYYDFEFLDSNTRRHDIYLDKDKRRKSSVANFKSKPFLLDELSQKIMYIWDNLLKGRQLKGITDTKLRNLQSLWLTKYQEWVRDEAPDAFKKWMDFVVCSIQKEFSIDDIKQYKLLIETIESGLFFDTLELYLGILKERIDEQNEGGV